MPYPTITAALLVAALCPLAFPLAAQTGDSLPLPPPLPDSVAQGPVAPRVTGDTVRPPLQLPDGGLVMLGSMAEERIRVMQLLGQEPTTGFLLRTPATLTAAARGERPEGFQLEWVAPRLETVFNSALPYSLNDGALWAGRGRNHQITAGVRLVSPRLSLVLAPQYAYSANSRFDIINYTGNERSPFASPWHERVRTDAQLGSADLPLRFGRRSLHLLVPGQSRLAVTGGPLELGASTENQWWGPGVRNAIVLSNNAQGVPRLFLRTNRPLRTRLGSLAAEWMIGSLSESRFFDTIPDNDTRSLSAAAVTFTPAWEPGLTVGVSRAVYAPADGRVGALRNLFDVFTDVGLPNARTPADTARPADVGNEIFAVFGRWVLPADGFEVYGEWARHERPRSLRDLLAAPNHTQGYTGGLMWARPVGGSVLRLGGEVTNLEQSATYRFRRPYTSYYTSRSIPQGYTQGGQVVGAAIGAGSSAQSLSADWFSERWSVGLFGGRIRWENDSHYTRTVDVTPYFREVGHDVSLLGGVRGAMRRGNLQVMAELTSAMRYNYLSQNLTSRYGEYQGVDVQNYTFRLTVAPFGGV